MPTPVIRRRASAAPATIERPRILGVDPSLSCTGYAYWHPEKAGALVTGTIETGHLRGAHRLFYARMKMAQVLDTLQPELVMYEDYAYNQRNQSGKLDMAELGGVYKTMFWERGIDLVVVSSTTWKAAAIGHGHADKPGVAAALRQHYGLHVAQPDEADATGLLICGEAIRGARTLPVFKAKSKRPQGLSQCTILTGKPQLPRAGAAVQR